MLVSLILRRTLALLACACASSCGPSAHPMVEASTTSTGSTGDEASDVGMSGTSSAPDAGTGLPEGCGDGVPEPGQFCFELVQVYERRPEGAAAFDLDGDGTDELLVGLRNEESDEPCGGHSDYSVCTKILRWSGSEFREVGQIPRGVAGSEETYHPHIDFDGDGRVDFVFKTTSQGVSVLLNEGGQALEPADLDPSWEVPQGDWYKGGAFPFKADGEGYADLLVGFETGLQVYAREGNLWVSKGPLLPQPNCLMHPAARGDLDEDGIEDVLVMGAILGCDWAPYYDEDPEFFAVHPYRSNPSTGLLDPWPSILPGTYVDDLWVRDFDGDGHLDVLFSMLRSDNEIFGTTWVRGRGDGTFTEAVVQPTVGSVQNVGDFDGDGDPDLLVFWREGNLDLGILEDLRPPEELAHTLFPEDPNDEVHHSPRCVGDFNGDGVTDVVVYVSTKTPEGPRLRDTAVWLSRP